MRTFVVRYVGYGDDDTPPGEVVIRMFADSETAVPTAIEAGPGAMGLKDYADEMRAAGIGVVAIASRMGMQTGLFDETENG